MVTTTIRYLRHEQWTSGPGLQPPLVPQGGKGFAETLPRSFGSSRANKQQPAAVAVSTESEMGMFHGEHFSLV